jgi:hypothetical protein
VADRWQPGSQGASGKKGEERRRVWVQEDGWGLRPVPVRIGLSNDTYAELLEGALTEGEAVVTGIHTSGSDGAPQTTLPGFGMRWRRQ